MPRRTTLAVSAALAAAALLAVPAPAAAPPPKDEGGRDAALGRAFALKQIAHLEDELLEVRSELRRKRVELELLQEKVKASPKMPVPEDKVEALMDESPELVRLQQAIDEARRDLKEAIRKAPRASDSVAYRRRLEAREKEFAAARARMHPRFVERVREQAHREVMRERDRVTERIAFLTRLDRVLTAEGARLRAKVGPARPDGPEKRVRELGAVGEPADSHKRKK